MGYLDETVDYFMRIQERRHREWQEVQDKVAKARKARGHKISDNELVDLLVDVKQLGGERVPDAVKIIQRLVDAPSEDPSIKTVTTALLEQAIRSGEDNPRRYHSEDLRKLMREFHLRDLRSEHLLKSDDSYSVVHICRRPRSKRRWWKFSRTLCHKSVRKLEVAERGEWVAHDYRRCGYCEAKDWSHIAECYEEPVEAEFDDPEAIDDAAIQLGSEHLQEAVVEIRAGVTGRQDARYSKLDEYLLGQIAEQAWDQAARRALLKELVERGDQPLLDAVAQEEKEYGGSFWTDRIRYMYDHLPVGKDRLVDLLGPDALHAGSTVNDLLNSISYTISEREDEDNETFEQRQKSKRLSAEEAERKQLREQVSRQVRR